VLSTALKLPVEQMETDAPFEKYGVDSLLVVQMTNHLEQHFGSLAKTLFFEYRDLNALTGYFLRAHRARLVELLGGREKAPAVVHTAPASTAVSSVLTTAPAPVDVVSSRPARRSRAVGLSSRQSPERSSDLEIAVIGLSGRYPQANNIEEFWENLTAGRDCIIDIPRDRWNHDAYFDPQKGKLGKSYGRWGGFVTDADKFDPLFFNISPAEAQFMDPQERVFLQCVYETLEDAGYTRESLRKSGHSGREGQVGVFVGVMYEDYQLYGAQAQLVGQGVALGGSPASIANRVSYFCDLHGPSLTVDTMCSSSLTTVHLACESLHRGECDVAIAGGVNLAVHPNKYLLLAQGRFLASEGRCASFGVGGDGYVPGEGVGAVLLKPLAQARAAADQIYGVIKGSAINHGGKTNGYSVPNPSAQTEVIAQALANSGVPARAISYLEAHGTGTSLGDPIEITGLSQAFERHTGERRFCAIGSVKSNIGHCEGAAGIAALTKVLLQMKHAELVPSLHSQVLNAHIDFESTPFVVQRERTPWRRPQVTIEGKTREYPRIAGISSFGAGGSNAHLIVEEHVEERPRIEMDASHPVIVPLSAKTPEQLQGQVLQLLQALDRCEAADLPDIAYTLQVGREAMEHRLALIVGSISELREKLGSSAERPQDAA